VSGNPPTKLWLVDPDAQLLEVIELDGANYRLLDVLVGESRVCSAPFDASEVELGAFSRAGVREVLVGVGPLALGGRRAAAGADSPVLILEIDPFLETVFVERGDCNIDCGLYAAAHAKECVDENEPSFSEAVCGRDSQYRFGRLQRL
jgi:hypothetical protein